MAIDPLRPARADDTDPQGSPAGRPPNARDAEAPGRTMPDGFRSHGAQGTTHDPNSVTTGTEVEPDDAYPPKGEERTERRASDVAAPRPAGEAPATTRHDPTPDEAVAQPRVHPARK